MKMGSFCAVLQDRLSTSTVLVALTLGISICPVQAADDAIIPVTAITAKMETMHRVINGIGTIEPLQSVIVRPRIEGQVVEIPFAEGEIVDKGSVLLKLDNRELVSNLVSAKAKKAQDEAQLRSAKLDAERYASLAEKGVASLSVMEQKNAANQQYTAAVQYDDAMIRNAETQLSFATILAPFTGRTGFKQVDIGSIVSTTSTNGIVTVTQMDPIGVSFVAPGDRFAEIRDALKDGIADVELETTDGTRKLSTGKLTIIDNAVDSSNGSIHLRATFDNKTGALWPGLPVATRLTVEVRKGVVVPDKALARGRDGLYAFVVGADHKVSKRSVKTAFVTDAMALVTDGINAGDQVVMDGQSRIADKVTVAVTPWTGSPIGELSGEVSQ
ncbi:efflux RND transporter periplasmic adaptor subunit [Agrobacterium vitis]|uniref:Efflux RND transporter periplasmic adaptor subunit n=1 Tax=Agrobacterium vitis TaxID=373 RepID=A0A368NP23_AGRVI|nr:efflux RND transporter periplasmic adaptor subunit [Agrobacterium vitis]KAA3509739.1 efflux RND transporter periplasmic adaptor subunit [Agrobacterium vitis]KAA3523362.1 efflux RND transporter periplasmic adaptor subunit [Agrobacterium vitis]MUO80218.1 efflux RND transporter periplasmic adaptor subunit [Agrobacterium vitis]MUO97363.1 efflux RND transporter periplasmic adaptor subunit [Agrobacterium vitis]MUP05256.1 efflux RND transporter periplasmic adaptor subunit [Agrobacterium vitis]